MVRPSHYQGKNKLTKEKKWALINACRGKQQVMVVNSQHSSNPLEPIEFTLKTSNKHGKTDTKDKILTSQQVT